MKKKFHVVYLVPETLFIDLNRRVIGCTLNIGADVREIILNHKNYSYFKETVITRGQRRYALYVEESFALTGDLSAQAVKLMHTVQTLIAKIKITKHELEIEAMQQHWSKTAWSAILYSKNHKAEEDLFPTIDEY